jgi:hypothetical protein
MSSHGPIVTCYFSLLGMFLKLEAQSSIVIVVYSILLVFWVFLRWHSSILVVFFVLLKSMLVILTIDCAFCACMFLFQQVWAFICALEVHAGLFCFFSMFLNCLYFVFRFADLNHVILWCWSQWWPYVFFIFNH